MRRGGGVIPPGKAGLVVLAFAMAPIVVKKFRPIVRWAGKKISSAGEKLSKMADEVERFDREKEEKTSREQERKRTSTVSKPRTESKVDNKSNDMPQHETASPHAQPEMDAQTTKPKGRTTTGARKPTPKKTIEGATPPANNPKRKRAKGP